MTETTELDRFVARVSPMAGLTDEATADREPLRECVRDAVQTFLATIGDNEARDLYRMVMNEVEAPLIETVLRHVGNNQTRAAAALGMTRATLRKKLKLYQLG